MTSVIPKPPDFHSKRITDDHMDNMIFYLKYKKDHEIKPSMVRGKCLKKLYSEIHSLVHDIQIKYDKHQSVKRDHCLAAKFLAAVLTSLPFLYCESREFEDYQWTRIAYDLGNADELLPHLVRYQVGPSFYISFGSITNQLKREFFKLFATNYKSPKHPDTADDNFHNSPIIYRDKQINEEFEYFTTDEIKRLIINGDRLHSDFTQSSVPKKDPANSEWYHHWGYVYETNKDALRAIELEIGNYHLEISFLQDLLDLRLGYFNVQSTNTSLSNLIRQKIHKINSVYLPRLQKLRAVKLKGLQSTKPFSSKFYDILHY
ncbi:hypothetical protein CLIB1444_06S01706 [[Candida] jaroonii]|uniref:Uncharacterized protein n=1 Tax=[Candida] jaroonii TaxID=467808 RepID=A0ACA9Y8P5_9ASCO|nr:hypothetical protein CLIB1444_06S01706 [[Candida] jaroonii]